MIGLKLNKKLREELRVIKEENIRLKNCRPTAEEVIKDLMKHEIGWYKWEDLDQAAKVAYWQNAQGILNNETFLNEVRKFIADMAADIVYNSNDYEKVINLRIGIVTLETLKERFEKIAKPEKEKKINLEKASEAI